MQHTKIILAAMLSVVLASCSTGSYMSQSDTAKQQANAEDSSNMEDKIAEQAATTTPAPTNIVQTQRAELAAGMTTAATTQAATPSPMTQSVSIGGQMGLAVKMSYQQVWAQTKKALPAAGYPIMEQDNTSGTYYVLDKVGTGGTIQRDTPIYQLRLQKLDDNRTAVTLNNAQNQPAANDVAQRILGALKDKLG